MESSAGDPEEGEDPPNAFISMQMKCKFCQKAFPEKKSCTSHEKRCDKFIVIPRKSGKSKHAAPTRIEENDDDIMCKFCCREFGARKNRNRHQEVCPLNPDAFAGFPCRFCNYKTKRKDNLSTHEKRVHANKSACATQSDQQSNSASRSKVDSSTKKKTPCLFENCEQEFYHKTALIDHLKICHPSVDLKDPIEKTFSCIQEFHSWKDKEQETSFSYFGQKSGQAASRVKYFYCQHDGSSHTKRKTSRSNAKGRIKVGHFCIAKMQVWKDKEEKIRVLYFPTHNHICKAVDFVHQPLSSEVNFYINERLTWGISPTKILRNVQKQQIPKSSTVAQIMQCQASTVSKKRLRERARKMRERRRFHKDEARALFLMVNQLSEEDDSILLYKPFNDKVKIGPKDLDEDPNSSDIFMLGFQTKRQAQLMAEHCHKIVLVDETHGTNHHKFQLLTLMIVDDNRRGWPVAHLITSKSDAETLQHFFKALKSKSPNTEFNCVMSDDDKALINGMMMGFNEKLKLLLCKWHLLKNFKKNLRSHVPSSIVDQMMTELRVMVNELDENIFQQLMTGFIKKYEGSTQTEPFISYFKSFYSYRPEEWAMCHRRFPHANINTTGHLESFHHRLKKVYLKRKVNRRLDDLVTHLLDIEWDDHLSRVRESAYGLAYQPQEISARHERGMKFEDDSIKLVEENTWDVKSSSNLDKYHIVRFHLECNSDLCFSKCSKVSCSGLCAHLYACSCPDNHPLCKHIHKLHSLLTRNLPNQMRDNETLLQELNEIQNIDAESEIVEEVPNMDAPESSSETDATTVNHRTVSRQKKELSENLSYLSDFLTSAEDNPSALAHAAVVSNDLVMQLKYMTAGNEENIPHMKPALKFNSNETLRTQASQVSSFRRPPVKRKRKQGFVSPNKKNAVIKDLIGLFDEDEPGVPNPCPQPIESGQSPDKSTFTPSLSQVSNPCDVLLKFGIEKVTLMNLKSLEASLPAAELRACRKWDPAFRTGWLYSSIIYSYLTKLEEKFPECLVLSPDLALRASRELSNVKVLQNTLKGRSEKKVVLLPANPSDSHWVIIAISIASSEEVQVRYYDPLQEPMSANSKKMVLKVMTDMKTIFPLHSGWHKIIYVQAAKQNDSYNCGVHICSFAEQILRKIPYQLLSDTHSFRKLMYHTIVGGCLKNLDHFDEEICGICCKKFADDVTENDNPWMSCQICDQWYHEKCVSGKGIVARRFCCPL